MDSCGAISRCEEGVWGVGGEGGWHVTRAPVPVRALFVTRAYAPVPLRSFHYAPVPLLLLVRLSADEAGHPSVRDPVAPGGGGFPGRARSRRGPEKQKGRRPGGQDADPRPEKRKGRHPGGQDADPRSRTRFTPQKPHKLRRGGEPRARPGHEHGHEQQEQPIKTPRAPRGRRGPRP